MTNGNGFFSIIRDDPLMLKTSILLVIGLVIYAFLKARIIKRYCFGCEEGGWWYKCKKDTGKGSIGCEIYSKIDDVIHDVEGATRKVVDDVEDLEKKIVKPIEESFEKIKNFGENVHFNIQIPNIPEIPKVDLSCDVHIPIINKTINPCSGLSTGLNDTTNILNKGIKYTSEGMNDALKELSTQIGDALRDISTEMAKIFTVFSSWLNLKKDFEAIYGEATGILKDIESLGIFKSIIYAGINLLSKFLPFSVEMLIFIIFLLITLPIIGGLYGFFDLLYKIIVTPIYNVTKSGDGRGNGGIWSLILVGVLSVIYIFMKSNDTENNSKDDNNKNNKK
jgi:hypothetical protein